MIAREGDFAMKCIRCLKILCVLALFFAAPVHAVRYVDVAPVSSVPLIRVSSLEDFETVIDAYKISVVYRMERQFLVIAGGTYVVLPANGFATLEAYRAALKLGCESAGDYELYQEYYSEYKKKGYSEKKIRELLKELGQQQTAIPIGEEDTQLMDDYDWYTSLDQVRTQTCDAIPASVVVQVALGYGKEDKAAAAEIASRRSEILGFLRRYFSSKTHEELRPENEAVLKQQICGRINADILKKSKIQAVMFTAKDIVAQ